MNAPMVLIWRDTYEDLTPESFEKVLDGFASGKHVKPGPQIDRTFSAPVGGPTTLTDAALYVQRHSGWDPSQPSLTDVAPKKVSPEANTREAPAPLETVAAEGAKDGVSPKATMKEALSEKAQPAPERKPQD